MLINLSQDYSILCDWIAEIRDQSVQTDRMRFRRNMERIGEIAGYEISRLLPYEEKEIQTPLGIANSKLLKSQPVLATILRAGLPLHQGLLSVFDNADSAFISAYHAGGAAARAECVVCAPAGRAAKSRTERKNDCRGECLTLDARG